MNKRFIFASLTLGVLACSCITEVLDCADFDNVPAVVENSGIEKDGDQSSYVSWIEVDRQGLKKNRYEAKISCPIGCDSIISPVYATGIQYRSHRLKNEASISERSEGNIIIRSYKCDYLVRYDGFEIPVSFITEKAFLKNGDSEIFMPTLSTHYSLEEPILTELADEKIGEKEYYCYQLLCRATAQTEEVFSQAQSSVKILVEKQPIIFDTPTVEPWQDNEDTDINI